MKSRWHRCLHIGLFSDPLRSPTFWYRQAIYFDLKVFIPILTIRQSSSIRPLFGLEGGFWLFHLPGPRKHVSHISWIHMAGGITSVRSRRFGTSISGGLGFGVLNLNDEHPKKNEACMFGGELFVATLAANQKAARCF